MKIVGYIHIYVVNHWKEIVEGQVERINNSGLIEAVDRIYYSVVGDCNYFINKNKYYLLQCSIDMALTELFTLNTIRKRALVNPDHKLFYIHTKGVTRPNEKCIQDWRLYMEYFCIDQWPYCLEALDHADTVGVNIRRYGKKRHHYSGNFWWANSSYIKTLPELSEVGYGRKVNRWDGEFWIGDGNPVMASLYESRKHHGTQQYGESEYFGKSPTIRLLGRK